MCIISDKHTSQLTCQAEMNGKSSANGHDPARNTATTTTGGGGFRRMAPHISLYLAGLCVVYAVCYQTADYFVGDMEPAPQYCPKGDDDDDDDQATPCRRPDLWAFQMVSVVAMHTSAFLGMHAWYYTQHPHKVIPATPAGRLLAPLPTAERLAAYALAYQVFDFVVSTTIPENCTFLMMTHHFMAGLVAYVSIRYTVLHYYSFFFLGLSEVSTLALVWMDLSNYFPPVPGSWQSAWLDNVWGPFFVVTFVWYRVLQWWPMSVRLWRDVRAVVVSSKDGKDSLWETVRPGQSPWTLYIFLVCNLPLGLLQLYWLTIILGEVQKTLAGAA